MKKSIKVLIVVLLLINGLGAIFGGLNLIIHPDGSSMQMSLDWLEPSPFRNYLIPGILLLAFNGIFSLFVLIRLFLKHKHNEILVIAQGLILTFWIAIQMIMLKAVVGIQIFYAAVGLLLILFGWLLHRFTNKQQG